LAVVTLIGPSASGKSTFARKFFKTTEILSSDYFRALVADDERDQSATEAAFNSLYYVADQRLARGFLTVIDATNVKRTARARVLSLAKERDCLTVAIVLNLPKQLCLERDAARPAPLGPKVINRQVDDLRQSLKHLRQEGFTRVYVLSDQAEADSVEIHRVPLWVNKRAETGPFDIIGDVHGCYDELVELLEKLGYQVDQANNRVTAPPGRRVIFLGDLSDRGPKSLASLRLAMGLVKEGSALCVCGNHDQKLQKVLRGSGSLAQWPLKDSPGAKAAETSGLAKTLAELREASPKLLKEIQTFLGDLRSHYVLDGGRLVVAHAGLPEKYQGRGSGRVRAFCLYGETTGERDEFGLPVRLPWAEDYRGQALVVYGHTPTPEPLTLNNTICLDTGCAFGGALSAYRYPEGEIAQVKAKRVYQEPLRPWPEPPEPADDILSVEDFLGAKSLDTRLRGFIKIKAENAAAALEAMSRFAADPHWLIYLPPTMSPGETSPRPDYLERPEEALDYYQSRGIATVICEEKHMGSRAVIIVGRDARTAQKRFQAPGKSQGIIYTRTGRHFFDDPATEAALLERLAQALSQSGFWEKFATDWVCLDTEILPWSAKALKLLRDQYASVGRAGREGLTLTLAALDKATQALNGADNSEARATLAELQAKQTARLTALELYVAAYRRYCWDVVSLDDYRIAPFHLLATEGRVWVDQKHSWHLETLAASLTNQDPLFLATKHLIVELDSERSVTRAIDWWEELTAAGGEGLVVKPLSFFAQKDGKLLQPAIKCRGREYLRIIYGPEYALGDNLARLKNRNLNRKRGLALNEFALGVEALERFVRREPLRRVHEAVWGVLALGSEPTDPRL
jgi:protein phosphatase